jgi:K+-transporting ATPase ATPase A chain
MTTALIQDLLFFALLMALGKPLGEYMGRLMDGNTGFPGKVLGPVECFLYRLMGIRAEDEMTWKGYLGALLLFNFLGIAAVFLLEKFQGRLPFNPQGFGALPNDLAMNTAVSFVTNTNWQAYAGETTMSHLTQMLGLAVQNFLSAATGLAVLAALARGLARRTTSNIGNFWIDLVRSTLYVLLPLSLVFALFLVSQGTVQTLAASVKTASGQVIALGPAASQVAIKMLGSNGGGFFNANGAHPFENPTALSNFLQTVAILLLPAACCFMFGRMVKDRRQGWALILAMSVIFVAMLALCTVSEAKPNAAFRGLRVDSVASAANPGGNMEGKELRFGVGPSALWATATTAASNGSVNAMHDSFTPLGGLVPLWLMQLGEVVFGGVGSGLYGMLMFVVVAVFVAGLMVGRTPEYLGKKIEAFEMKMASLVILIPAAVALVGTAVAVVWPPALASLGNPGPHGFSQALYAFSSAANNNGSAFAGLNANTPFYNWGTALAMLAGRFGVLIPVMAVAGSLAAKKHTPESAGTLPTHTPLFVGTLLAVVLLVGALTFLPSLALGPIAEQLMLR